MSISSTAHYPPLLLLMPKLLPATATTSTTEIPMSITLTAHYLPATATTATTLPTIYYKLVVLSTARLHASYY